MQAARCIGGTSNAVRFTRRLDWSIVARTRPPWAREGPEYYVFLRGAERFKICRKNEKTRATVGSLEGEHLEKQGNEANFPRGGFERSETRGTT